MPANKWTTALKNVAYGILCVLVLTLICSWVVLSPAVAMSVYNQFVFYPTIKIDIPADYTEQICNMGSATFEEVGFPAENGQKLSGWMFKRSDTKRMILVSHGNAGNLSHRGGLLATLLKAPASVFIYDYQGYGKSIGSPTLAGVCKNGLAAYDFLVHSEHVSPENLIVYGESIGCGVTSYISAHRKVGAVILQSPFTSFPDIARQKLIFMAMYPDFMFPPDRLDNLGTMKLPHPPLLIIHGDKDTILPVSNSLRIFEQACEPKRLVRLHNSDHNDILDKDLVPFLKSVEEFVGTVPG